MQYNNTGKKIEDCIELKIPSIICDKIDPWVHITKRLKLPHISYEHDLLKPLELPKAKVSAEIPIGNFTGKFSASAEELRAGLGTGFGKACYAG